MNNDDAIYCCCCSRASARSVGSTAFCYCNASPKDELCLLTSERCRNQPIMYFAALVLSLFLDFTAVNLSCTLLHYIVCICDSTAGRGAAIISVDNDGTIRFVSSRAFKRLSYRILLKFWRHFWKSGCGVGFGAAWPLSDPIFDWSHWQKMLLWRWIVSRSIELALSFP